MRLLEAVVAAGVFLAGAATRAFFGPLRHRFGMHASKGRGLEFAGGPVLAEAGGTGFVTAFLAHEWLRRRAHAEAPRAGHGRCLRIRRFRRHFEGLLVDPGVTSALRDGVFGALRWDEEPVRVLRRLANDWLIGPGVPPAARGRTRR